MVPKARLAKALCGAVVLYAGSNASFAANLPANCSAARVVEGCGTFTWPDGSKYVGGFKAGTFDGHGIVTYSDGSRFEADFQKGTARGEATFTARDGSRTLGAFHNIGNDKSFPHAAPKYPFWRSILGGEGSVVLTVIVAEDGKVTNVQIDAPSSYEDYDEAAVDAVKTWRYSPATIAGKTVKVPHRIEVKFPEPRGS
jgi:TonB family protein